MKANIVKIFQYSNPKAVREFNPAEILNLLMRINIQIWWCWGVTEQIIVKDKMLILRVNGLVHVGYLSITLSFKDLFDIHLFKENGEFVKSIEDIYVDQLQEVIDLHIESSKVN